MTPRPSIVVTSQMRRQRQTLSDQLVLGLVTGGLFGPGLLIDGRESECIRFRKLGGLLRAAPDRGEILLATEPSGETRVQCQLWCRGLALRRLLSALLLGAGLGAALAGVLWGLRLATANRWLWGGVCGLAAALLSYWIWRWLDSIRLRRQIDAFLHNTTYLRAI